MSNSSRERLNDGTMTQWARRKTFFMTTRKFGYDTELSARGEEWQKKDIEDLKDFFDYRENGVSDR